MGIRFFRGEKIRFEHEYRQIREIINLLRKEYQKEPVYVLTNVLVANKQLDCVLLTRSGPLILELKAFSGKVHGLENGPWEVITKDGGIPIPNLFTQAKTQRQDFIDRLIPVYREQLPHIDGGSLRKMGAWIYFCKGSTYADGQIDFRKVKWFRIVTADTLLDTMRFLDSGYTLRIQDMDALVAALHLEEYEFDTDRAVIPAPPRDMGRFRLSKGMLAAIVIAVIICGAIALLFLVPGAKVAMISSINGIVTRGGGLLKEGSRDLIRSESTPDDSRDSIMYLNRIRVSGGIEPVPFDDRAYQLALARSADMAALSYLDYTNPETGSSAESMKGEFGIEPGNIVIESAYGQWNGYTFGIEKQAIDAWISDEGNRYRLFSPIDGGAVACSHGYCSFIGIFPRPESPPLPGSPLFVEGKELPAGMNSTATAG
jgi:Nuclease-related domain